MIIPKFRVWDKVKAKMYSVEVISFINNKVYPVYTDTSHRYVPFNESVLMQSTGLVDKNGKEIFEGDIVKDGGEDVGVVVYDKECGAYGLKYKSNLIITFDSLDEMCDWKGSVVIGNIYENSELLEEE